MARQTAAFAAGTRFTAAFGTWVAGQRRPSAQDATVARLLEDRNQYVLRIPAGDTKKAARTLRPPATAPGGLAQFALDPATLERAVAWMLREAARANPDPEHKAWCRAGCQGHPRFSFGMYANSRAMGLVTLEIRDLRASARRIDGTEGGAVARALAASEGITGYRTAKDGTVRFAYGLTVVLGVGWQSLASIQPGGAASLQHERGEDAGSPAPAPRAQDAPHQATSTGPQTDPAPERPRTPSRLNRNAPEFVMPDG